jgi:hypothetical protein
MAAKGENPSSGKRSIAATLTRFGGMTPRRRGVRAFHLGMSAAKSVEPSAPSKRPIDGAGLCEAGMSDESKLRKWAAEAARQAQVEKDANEARRLSSFAQYWTRLADLEASKRDDRAA